MAIILKKFELNVKFLQSLEVVLIRIDYLLYRVHKGHGNVVPLFRLDGAQGVLIEHVHAVTSLLFFFLFCLSSRSEGDLAAPCDIHRGDLGGSSLVDFM